MEANNILSAGIEQLNEIMDCVLELNGNMANSKQQKEEADRLEKAIKSTEKDIVDEIQQTTKKRRAEIEASFDKQANKVRDKIKKIKDERSREKSLKISERIATETAPLRMENKSLKLDAHTIARQEKLPFYCNSKLYLALYFPSCLTDFVLILAALAVVLLLLPCGIYFLLLPESIIYLVLTYVITVLVFGSLYLSIGNVTRDKYKAKILQIRDLRSRIRANRRKIAGIRRSIRKDRDESGYELHGYDEELATLDREEDDILAQKKDALTVFENVTAKVIADEIRETYKDKLTKLKSESDEIKARLNQTEERIKALTLKIASDYEPFLGKDLMSAEKLDALANIIQTGNATTISEAIAYYRQGGAIAEKANAND
jgi:VIT1/CCC1 family predicted Fe2+/Mn2+ transporter